MKTHTYTYLIYLILFVLAPVIHAQELPVRIPNGKKVSGGLSNEISLDQIYTALKKEGNKQGLLIDFDDSNLRGTIYSGPYPFEEEESDITYRRYRMRSPLNNGRGVIPISRLYTPKYDANDWGKDLRKQATLSVRLDLWKNLEDEATHYGLHDFLVDFWVRPEDTTFHLATTIIEGPFVYLTRSDDGYENGTSVTVAWETMQTAPGKVVVEGVGSFENKTGKTKKHEVKIMGLKHDEEYEYYVQNGKTRSPAYTFTTAPEKGKENITIAYAGDSREGVGGGEREFMGVNRYILRQLADDALRRGAEIFLFGGDLVNGYTTDTEDFKTQLKAWKQAMEGFMHLRAVYPAQGNHESLLNIYKTADSSYVMMDKFPYDESAEAIFAEELVLPENAPELSDERRPEYKEEVYAFQYGALKIIAFNNNYWYTDEQSISDYGGSPEGYIMPDQMNWIKRQIQSGEEDPSVKAILLYAQEPVFPNGGHVSDAMWYEGNNNVRAYTYRNGKTLPEEKGIIEVRNELWEAVSSSKKVAAVLTSDEHGYHRTRIDKNTPVGVMSDDTDGDGRLNAVSPNKNFRYPTWHITSGGGGAPYYSRQKVPWTEDVALYTSQFNYSLISLKNGRLTLEVYNQNGQRLDYVKDLMKIKK
ncbi:MAG: metallophosphoesterase family protein [Bacteroidales bacterium]|nr:metallophosphoesterase family protein [Bacteroidales bacterium]